MVPLSRVSPLPWWQSRWLIAVLALCAGIPLLIPSFPPLIDLPGHYSGYYVQENLRHTPALARFFTFQWKFIPNLGVELLIVPLTPLLGLHMAVKLIVAVIPALAVAGMLWVAREVHGRIPSTALFALPLAYGYPLIFGFVNFCLAMSLALLAFGWWLTLSRRGRTRSRSLIFAAVAPTVMLAHVLGYGVLGLLCGGAVLGNALSSGTPVLKALWRAVMACIPMAWPLLLIPFWRGGASPPSGDWLDVSRFIIGLATVLREQFQWWDLFSAALVFAVAALPLLFWRKLDYALVLAIPAALIWLLAVFLPFNMFGSDFSNVRLIPLACALTILAVRPLVRLPSWVTVLGAGFFIIRLGVMAFNMEHADTQIERELGVLTAVQPGSRVATFVVLPCDRQWEPPRMQHIGSYVTPLRNSFSNDQFTRGEGQLLGIKHDEGSATPAMPAAELMSRPCSRWPGKPTLAEALQQTPLDQIDYLWLVDVPADQLPQNARFHVLQRGPHSILFDVRSADGESHPKSKNDVTRTSAKGAAISA